MYYLIAQNYHHIQHTQIDFNNKDNFLFGFEQSQSDNNSD